MQRLLSNASVGLVAVVFAIAGCGGGTGGTAGGTGNATLQPPAPAVSDAGGSSSGGQAASAAPQASPGGAGGTAVTCNQLTKADVQPLLVDPIVNVTVTAAGIGGEGQQCVFDTGDSGHAVDVLVLSGDLATSGYAQQIQDMTKPVSVPGIGTRRPATPVTTNPTRSRAMSIAPWALPMTATFQVSPSSRMQPAARQTSATQPKRSSRRRSAPSATGSTAAGTRRRT